MTNGYGLSPRLQPAQYRHRPSYVAPPQVPVAPTDVLGSLGMQQQGLQNAYNVHQQNYAANLGGLSGLAGTGLAGGLGLAWSDARMKTDVKEVGRLMLPGGEVPIKSFRFHGDPVRRMGMLAQDVEKVDPQAVFTHPVTGMKGLNYARVLLGAHHAAMGGGNGNGQRGA